MANMSYCRWQNTLSDLRDCYEHIFDDAEELSPWERQARKRLIALCKEIADNFEDEEE